MFDPHRFIDLQQKVIEGILHRTGRRVRDLSVEVQPDGVVLHGSAVSYHVKQLAQHGVWDVAPDVGLRNEIVVES